MTTPTQTQQPQALSDLAFWLAIQHQEEQQQIAQQTAAGLAILWGILQFRNLDESTPAWLHATTLQVEQKFRESEQAAYQFVQGSKWAVEPLSDALTKVNTVFPTQDFQLAMRATGPVAIKRATGRAVTAPERDSELPLGDIAPEVYEANLNALMDDIMSFGKLNSTGAAVKFALNGGRGEVQQLVIKDARERIKNRQTIGWARFTEDSATGPCYFCALLASQGAVFLDATSFDRSNNLIREPVPEGRRRGNARTTRRAFIGDGPAKVHDHCKCSLRPVYRTQDSRDARAKYFLRQYRQMFKDYPWLNRLEGTEDMRQWRKVYKRPPAYADRPAVNLAAVRRNRELVAQELGAGSDHVKFWDRQIKALERAS